MKKIIILLFLIYSSLFSSDILVLDNKVNFYDNFKISYHKDMDSKLNISNIEDFRFENHTKNKFTLGYTKSDAWIKLKVLNLSDDTNFVVSLNEVFYEKAILYYKSEKSNFIKKENGLFTPIKNREVKRNHLSYKINLPKNNITTIYLQLNAKYAYFGNISLIKESHLQETSFFNINSIYLFVFGIISIIIVFNLFLYSKFKEKIYILYVGYAFFNLIYYINISGLLVYFDLQKYIYDLQLSAAFMIGFLILFTRELLHTYNYTTKLDKLLKYSSILFFILGVLVVISYQPWNKFINNLAGIITIILIITSIIIYFKGNTKSKYYVFAMIFYFIFVILFTFMVMGILEYTDFTRYGFIIASALETVIFSLMLSDRYNQLKEKQIEYQNRLLKIKAKNETFLENEVEKRTNELKINYEKIESLLKERELLLKEVHHRVKNNFHMLSGMLWIEEQNDNSKKSKFSSLRNRTKSMALIHEQLIRLQ